MLVPRVAVTSTEIIYKTTTLGCKGRRLSSISKMAAEFPGFHQFPGFRNSATWKLHLFQKLMYKNENLTKLPETLQLHAPLCVYIVLIWHIYILCNK